MDTINKVVDAGKDVVKTFSNKEQSTKRHQTDMMSDNQFSKNIRPLIMVWALTLFTADFVLDALDVAISADRTRDIAIICFIAIGFYFPMRSIEKRIRAKLERK